MARPPLKGLQYYPMDVDTWQDRKIRKLCKAHGAQGKCVYDYITSMCYAEHGYYLPVDANLYFDVADMIPIPGMDEHQVEAILKYCMDVELLNAHVFATQQIITSSGIQRRYIYACRVSNRRAYGIHEEHLLLAADEIREHEILITTTTPLEIIESQIMPENSEHIEDIQEQNPDLQAESTQRKGNRKESKAKEIKVWRFTPPSLEEVQAYFVENGATAELGAHAWKYYSTPGADGKTWVDSGGKPVKNWKQKMLAVWLNPSKLAQHKQNGNANQQSKGTAIRDF